MIRKVFCLLLAAMFALPCFALGEAVQQRLVVWTALPDGTMGEAVEGVDYIWSYTDETRTTVWVQTLPESQINPAQVVVEIVDTDGQTYRFYDTLNNTEWLDFASTGFLPQSYALVNTATGETVAGMTLAVSPDAAPAQGGDVPGAQQTMPPEATGFVRAGAGTNVADGQGGMYQLGADAVGTVYPDQKYNDGTGALWFLVQFADGTSGYVQLGTVSFISQEEYMGASATPVPQQTMPADATGFVRAGAGTNVADGQGGMYQLGADAVGTAYPDQAYNDGTGALWFLVQFADGTSGYVQVGTVNFISQEEYISATATPVPQQTMPAEATGFVRAGAGTVLSDGQGGMYQLGAEAVGTINPDQKYNDETGALWFLVQFADGTQGYVQLGTVSFISQDEYISATATPVPQQTMPADVTGYVRASAGTNIADGQGGLAQLGAEAVGTVYPDQAYNDGTGALWFLVQFADGTSGYVQLGTVSFISQEEYINATATPVPQQTMPADATGYVRAASGTVLSNGRGQTIWISKEMVGALLGESYNDSDGSLWFLVEFEDGTQGYVQLGTVNFISQQEYADATATPSPAPTQTATAAPTQTATAVPQQTMPPQATGYVRAGAGTVLSNGRGQMIWISKEMVGVSLGGSYHDDDGSLWFLVQFEDGTQGYVQLYSVSFISESEYRSATATASPSPTATAVITAQPTIVPTATPYLQQSTGYKRVSISGATLLSWPNVGAPAIRLLNYGEAVYTVEQLYDGNGILLDYVHTDDGTWGYVANTSLVKMTQQEIYDYYRTAAPSPTVAPTYSVSGFSGYGMILTANGGTVNFRTAPSMTGSSVISRLNNRSLVRVLGEVQSGGYTWYQCESNGSSGYIRGDYINLLSIAEYTQVLASGSYTSNNATVKVTATANNVTQTTWTTPSANKQTSGITFVTIAPMTQRPSLSPSPTVTATATLRPTIATMNYVRVSAGTEVSNGQGTTTTFEQDMLGQYQNQSYRDSEGTRWYLVKFKDDSTAYVKYEDMTFITQTEYESATAAPSLSPSPLATTPGPMATSTDFPTEESSGFSISGLIIALAVLLVVAAGGLYGYTVYNKSRRRQAKERERNAAAGKKPGAPGQPGDAARKPAPPANSAVRRPVPPAGPAGNAPARPGEAPQDRKLSPSGTAYHQQMEASRPGQRELHARQPGGGTPRPQTPPQRENPYARPVQEVKTNVPRASVDGKYVGDARVPQEEYRARRMPVAPPPTEVDETPVRRHKRSQSRAEEGGETDKKE